jgi:hypothetical protein
VIEIDPQASTLGALLAEVFVIGQAAPDLVASELRPIVESLRARHLPCSGCGLPHVQKRQHVRKRNFCQLCRNGGRGQKVVDSTSG